MRSLCLTGHLRSSFALAILVIQGLQAGWENSPASRVRMLRGRRSEIRLSRRTDSIGYEGIIRMQIQVCSSPRKTVSSTLEEGLIRTPKHGLEVESRLLVGFSILVAV